MSELKVHQIPTHFSYIGLKGAIKDKRNVLYPYTQGFAALRNFCNCCEMYCMVRLDAFNLDRYHYHSHRVDVRRTE